jgi:hypothetical protein
MKHPVVLTASIVVISLMWDTWKNCKPRLQFFHVSHIWETTLIRCHSAVCNCSAGLLLATLRFLVLCVCQFPIHKLILIFLNPTWTGGGGGCALRGVPMNSKLLEFFTYHLNLPLKNFFFQFLSTALRKLNAILLLNWGYPQQSTEVGQYKKTLLNVDNSIVFECIN